MNMTIEEHRRAYNKERLPGFRQNVVFNPLNSSIPGLCGRPPAPPIYSSPDLSLQRRGSLPFNHLLFSTFHPPKNILPDNLYNSSHPQREYHDSPFQVAKSSINQNQYSQIWNDKINNSQSSREEFKLLNPELPHNDKPLQPQQKSRSFTFVQNSSCQPDHIVSKMSHSSCDTNFISQKVEEIDNHNTPQPSLTKRMDYGVIEKNLNPQIAPNFRKFGGKCLDFPPPPKDKRRFSNPDIICLESNPIDCSKIYFPKNINSPHSYQKNNHVPLQVTYPAHEMQTPYHNRYSQTIQENYSQINYPFQTLQSPHKKKANLYHNQSHQFEKEFTMIPPNPNNPVNTENNGCPCPLCSSIIHTSPSEIEKVSSQKNDLSTKFNQNHYHTPNNLQFNLSSGGISFQLHAIDNSFKISDLH
jgi:hypothetical protein